MSERYVVQKFSGSRYAYVYDTKAMRVQARYDVLKGEGKRNGWNIAAGHAARLNKTTP